MQEKKNKEKDVIKEERESKGRKTVINPCPDRKKKSTIKDEKNKDLEEKVIKSKINSKRIKEKSHFREYTQKIFDKQLQMIDYSKLFSYMDAGMAKKALQPYSIYKTESKDKDSYYPGTITISKDEIEEIIVDKLLENMLGFSANRVQYAEKEAFRLYKIFNGTFIEMRYSMGIG